MPRPASPSRNPFLKHLVPLERLRRGRHLQRAVPNAEQDSLLLALPAELRNRIYHLVLVNEDEIEVDAEPFIFNFAAKFEFEPRVKADGNESRAVIKAPALLRTCQMISNEATQLYYSSNSFFSRDPAKLLYWVQGLGHRKAAMLKSVGVTHRPLPDVHDNTGFLHLLFEFEMYEGYIRRNGATGEDIFRFFIGTNANGKAFTKSEIQDLMTEEQLSGYHQYRKEMIQRFKR